MTFEVFAAEKRAAGYDEVLVREWKPDQVLEVHRHPFAVSVFVARGELWLTIEGRERHLKAGDTFEVAREVPHAERYGSEGATFWVARAH